MKHLITGGSGFIWDKIARQLIERGEGVRVLDIRADPARAEAVEFVEGSVTDREAVASAMRGRATNLTCIRQCQVGISQHSHIARR